ncbi:MAG: hypothetical protein J2P54_18210 [Bradyrhizobiaceae bacterium]|nr:hypothetical protein [Bradyrhizobiaceae bacterium]
MFKIAAALIFVLALTACGAVDTMTEGFKHAKAVESDLEGSTGVRPQVGFNWYNGRLISVTVQYPRLIESRSLSDLAEAASAAIGREFKQMPDKIVLAFSVAK